MVDTSLKKTYFVRGRFAAVSCLRVGYMAMAEVDSADVLTLTFRTLPLPWAPAPRRYHSECFQFPYQCRHA